MQDRKSGDQTRQSLGIKRNIRLTLAFDGTNYHGWQVQNNSPTVQGLVSAAISRITGEKVTLTGCGRTDAGTHARGLVANFLSESRIKPGQFLRGLNGILPSDIRVLSARQVPIDFHARKSAISKVYRYQIYLGSVLPPHHRREHFHYPFPVDIPTMVLAAKMFPGEHDFASFAKTSSTVTNTVRCVYRCDLKKKGHRLLFTVEGNGFLRHMVRNMAGTLLEVGRGAISLAEFKDLFLKRDRTLAGFTAPAQGLALIKVKY